jgi:hypothetical protein
MKKLLILAVFAIVMVIGINAKAQIAVTDTIEFTKMDSAVKVEAVKWATQQAYGVERTVTDIKSVSSATYVKGVPSRTGKTNDQILIEYVSKTDGNTKYALFAELPDSKDDGNGNLSVTGPGGDDKSLPAHK